jgi:hypothetical protein
VVGGLGGDFNAVFEEIEIKRLSTQKERRRKGTESNALARGQGRCSHGG